MKKEKSVQLKWVALASLLNNTGAAFIWPLTTMYVIGTNINNRRNRNAFYFDFYDDR